MTWRVITTSPTNRTFVRKSKNENIPEDSHLNHMGIPTPNSQQIVNIIVISMLNIKQQFLPPQLIRNIITSQCAAENQYNNP